MNAFRKHANKYADFVLGSVPPMNMELGHCDARPPATSMTLWCLKSVQSGLFNACTALNTVSAEDWVSPSLQFLPTAPCSKKSFPDLPARFI